MELFKAAKEAMAMRSKFNEMEKKLKANVINVEYKGIKIQVNAKNEFLSFEMPEDLLKEKKEKIEKLILDAFKSASDKAQDVMAQESKKIMGDMKIPGL
ncbi:MAG: YbaB/EbfC family nucleoid-associated protein [Endomicrobium sp.]|jgi:DNA-binding protein YbaB|nr:YbaB/EbfC family nucleoid-associated protein [Endomicrobium sp.]